MQSFNQCCPAKRLSVLTAFFLIMTLSCQTLADEAANRTTVALTVAVSEEAPADHRELAESLLTLLELEVAQRDRVSVVERQQLDLTLHELALSVDVSKVSERKLRLGKLVNADLLLTMELLPREPDADLQNVLVRIVESLTGAICGVVVTPIELVTVDESAAHIAKYLSAVSARPTDAVVTVAVAPFESLGRFNRLKPMELGLRDMIASRLRRWSDLDIENEESRRSNGLPEKGETDSGNPFLVLQRSNMEQLLKELDLVQSGLVDQSRLPKSMPTRAASYLVHGTIDERNENGFEIIVSAEVVQAASGKAVREFEFATEPKELPQRLAAQIDLIAGFLRHPDRSVSQTPGIIREINEAEFLFAQVVKDLRRYGRLTPADFSSRRYELPKTVSTRFDRGGVARVDTPQDRHILRKAIDRLESTLFIMPDRADVCYSLAFCYSYHIDGIMNLKRADELLRRVISMDGDGPLGVAALRLLSELCFHHHLGKCAPEDQSLALEQLLFAFRAMPDRAKNGGWADIPDLIRDVISQNDPVRFAAVTDEIVRATEMAPKNLQYKLAMNSIGFASNTQFEKWADGDNLTLMQVACRGLGQRAWAKRQYEASASWYLHAANALLSDERMKKSSLVDNFRIKAAGALLKGEKLNEARELLESFRPSHEDGSVNLGYWAQRIGDCYEQLGHPEKALAIYVEVADLDESFVNNSDLVERILRLGGVPISEDRVIDVRYVRNPPGGTSNSLALATDGNLIFSAGNFAGFATGKPGRGILAYDPIEDIWHDLSPEGLGRVTCMDYSHGTLWIGTHQNGLWRGDASGSYWKQLTGNDGLPDMTVSAVAADETGAYVGVGSGSGGLVRIGLDNAIHVMEGQNSPTRAPVDIVVQNQSLFVSTKTVLLEMDLKTGKWRPLGREGYCRVFGTESGVWGTFDTHQLFRMDELKKALKTFNDSRNESKRRDDPNFVPGLRSLKFEDGHFQESWFPRGSERASYHVKFAIEWDDEIWFGGSPWSRFQSVGLYRCNMETGEFSTFTPHDGFRLSTSCMTYAAVVRDQELYVATSAGLAVITRHE